MESMEKLGGRGVISSRAFMPRERVVVLLIVVRFTPLWVRRRRRVGWGTIMVVFCFLFVVLMAMMLDGGRLAFGQSTAVFRCNTATLEGISLYFTLLCVENGSNLQA